MVIDERERANVSILVRSHAAIASKARSRYHDLPCSEVNPYVDAMVSRHRNDDVEMIWPLASRPSDS